MQICRIELMLMAGLIATLSVPANFLSRSAALACAWHVLWLGTSAALLMLVLRQLRSKCCAFACMQAVHRAASTTL
eukprot:CAMPEP_0183361930 /NCGR_PEP_ID=MMETSP0164_2-20130417/65111_1 /TAXON_ID=221442 /ORGANISM="Coccolithus pelagicus ssp braarudi, Strain PLY182g" /LENGTH=75 /DNA_ID=CAMNT_0025536653 /DNA_START=73 /DNA_END=296 /DNA_ORIENTATION=-